MPSKKSPLQLVDEKFTEELKRLERKFEDGLKIDNVQLFIHHADFVFILGYSIGQTIGSKHI
ncbi:hypothetical protein [Bacillus chungangensis]|uniref:Uncharacterized protein n=1 Tax=Bacillus chungangensis TaxID=587633 RepID=A0ABT9WMR2_9BACI|nr:hypothetical protein [Bacillus chungangensis]MDQ0174394.1 hypothetical protein [Bacillus chungangensis]